MLYARNDKIKASVGSMNDKHFVYQLKLKMAKTELF